MAPSPEFGAPNLKSAARPGRPRGPFPCAPPADSLTRWPFKTPPPLHPPISPAHPPHCPPFRIASGTCSPPSGQSTPHPPVREVLRGIGGEGRGEGRGREAACARAPAGFARPPVAKVRPRRARSRCAVPSPRPPRREARARPPPAADRVVASARRASPQSVHIAAAPEPGSPGRPGGGGGGRDGTRSLPGSGWGRLARNGRGGDARRGGLDRRVGGLPTPPAPPAGLGSTAAASDREGGRA